MNRKFMIIVCWCLGVLTPDAGSMAQVGPQFQAFIIRVNSAQYQDRKAIVDSFMVAAPAFPFIEGSIAHFIFRGPATSVTVPGDANNWDIAGFPMTPLSTTDLWYCARVFENDARLDYKFVVNGSTWILDPLNPHTVSGGFGPNSELAMPAYVQPWEIQPRPSLPHGRVESRSIYSINRSTTYSVKVYMPPGYDNTGIAYPAVYFQDGSEYISLGSAVTILDNLIDTTRIAPVIAVFVTPTNRNEEYAGSVRTQYRLFFANELVPFIDTLYRTLRSPESRLVLGDSYGGNISALISYYHPDIFGKCGLHSGAFQANGYEAYNLIVSGANKSDSIRYCSVWGTYETGLTQNMEQFRDALLGKGYSFSWMETHEGHSWGQWRATTDTILQAMFPPSTLSAPDLRARPSSFGLLPNYPNPFNPATTITFQLSHAAFVTLRVFDVLGREVAALVNAHKPAGAATVRFDGNGLASGVYMVRLESEGRVASGKMMLLK